MEKPLLLLDIDGVLNAFAPRSGLRSTDINGYRILLNPDHVEWVREFEKHFEVVWSTMWRSEARRSFAPEAGFGAKWDYIDFNHYWNDEALSMRIMAESQHLTTGWSRGLGSVGEYKHPGFVQTIDDRPAVIVDDDLALWQHDWAVERSLSVPTETIQPDPNVGLCATEAELILQFADKLRSANMSCIGVQQ